MGGVKRGLLGLFTVEGEGEGVAAEAEGMWTEVDTGEARTSWKKWID